MNTPEKDNNKIDDIVRKSLADYEVPYNENDWNEMKNRLSGDSGIFNWNSTLKIFSAITGTVVISGLIYFYSQNLKSDESVLAENKVAEKVSSEKAKNSVSENSVSDDLKNNTETKKPVAEELPKNTVVEKMTPGIRDEKTEPTAKRESEKIGNRNVMSKENKRTEKVKNQGENLIAQNILPEKKIAKQNSSENLSAENQNLKDENKKDNEIKPEKPDEPTAENKIANDSKIPIQPAQAENPPLADSTLTASNIVEEKMDSAISPLNNDTLALPAKPSEEDFPPQNKKKPQRNFADKVLLDYSENPAFAGLVHNHKIDLKYFDQWLGLPFNKRPTTMALSYDGFFEKLKSSLGFYYSLLQTGNTSIKTFNLSYAYQIFAKEKMQLKIGVSANYNMKTLKQKGLTFPEQLSDYGFIDEISQQADKKQKNYVQLNAGIYQRATNFYFAFSVFNINSPNVSFGNAESKLPIVLNIHSGYYLFNNNNTNLALLLAVKINMSNNLTLFSPSLLLSYKKIILAGVGLKNNNQLTGYLGVDLFERIQFRFAASYPTSKNMRTFGNISTLEGHLIYQFKRKEKL